VHRTVTTYISYHASLLSINPDVLKLNVAQELKAWSVKCPGLLLEAHADRQHLHSHNLYTVMIPNSIKVQNLHLTIPTRMCALYNL